MHFPTRHLLFSDLVNHFPTKDLECKSLIRKGITIFKTSHMFHCLKFLSFLLPSYFSYPFIFLIKFRLFHPSSCVKAEQHVTRLFDIQPRSVPPTEGVSVLFILILIQHYFNTLFYYTSFRTNYMIGIFTYFCHIIETADMQ